MHVPGADFFLLSRSSAEDAPEELMEGESSVNNVVYSFRLTATQFDKKSYMTYLKVRFRLAVRVRTWADGGVGYRDT